MRNNLYYSVGENANVCSPREEGRSGMMLPCGRCQLQHILSFILPTESFFREVRRELVGGRGTEQVLCLLLAWLEHNKTASAADTPSSLQCQRMREARSPLWTSHLGRHSACTKKRSETKTEWCFLPFLMLLTQIMLASDTWHPQPVEVWSWPGIPRCFSYTSNGVTSCAHCLLLSCHSAFFANSISHVKIKYWEQSWSETSCILRCYPCP